MSTYNPFFYYKWGYKEEREIIPAPAPPPSEYDKIQDERIEANREDIERLYGEVTDYNLDDTTFVIRKRKEEITEEPTESA